MASQTGLTEAEKDAIFQRVLGCAFTVHNALGKWYMERVYQNALMIELAKQGLTAEAEVPLNVYYDGALVGDFRADIVVARCFILELKAVKALQPIHHAQLLSYMQAASVDDGILLNFGSERLEYKRKFLEFHPRGYWAATHRPPQ